MPRFLFLRGVAIPTPFGIGCGAINSCWVFTEIILSTLGVGIDPTSPHNFHRLDISINSVNNYYLFTAECLFIVSVDFYFQSALSWHTL